MELFAIIHMAQLTVLNNDKGLKTMRYLILIVLLASCTAPTRSEQTLRDAGFTDVKITGYSPFMCGQDDDFSTGFIAANPSGKAVEGTVCCGFMKGCTIRF